MANAYKCDRCGEYYMDDSTPRLRFCVCYYSLDGHKDGLRVDYLCPDCSKFLDDWMKRKDNQ